MSVEMSKISSLIHHNLQKNQKKGDFLNEINNGKY